MGNWEPLQISPTAKWSDFISEKKKKIKNFFEFISKNNSGEKVKKGCGRIKLQENVIGTRVEEGSKDCMRLANGNSAMNGEIVKRSDQQRKKFKDASRIPDVIMKQLSLVTIGVPISIHLQQPICS